MSVPFGKRKKKDTSLQAEQDLRKVIVYTINMCENSKIFPKKCRWTLCNRIIDSCLSAFTNIRIANETDMSIGPDFASYRLSKEDDLLDEITKLWQLMTVAKECYNIPNEKIQTWSDMMYKADIEIRAWNKSDIKKSKELKFE